MKKLSIIAVIIMSFLIQIPVYADSPASQLANILQSLNSISANFSQQLYNSKGKLLQQASGSMAILRPGKFRWVVNSPRRQLIIADGRNLWIYDKDLKQVSVNSISRGIGGSPAVLLSGSAKGFMQNFFTTYQDGWFILRPKAGNFKLIYLRFDGNRIRQMRLMDKLGRTSVFAFSNVQVNHGLSPSQFYFSPPKGVDIIGKQK